MSWGSRRLEGDLLQHQAGEGREVQPGDRLGQLFVVLRQSDAVVGGVQRRVHQGEVGDDDPATPTSLGAQQRGPRTFRSRVVCLAVRVEAASALRYCGPRTKTVSPRIFTYPMWS